jgi:hypothetical protein
MSGMWNNCQGKPQATSRANLRVAMWASQQDCQGGAAQVPGGPPPATIYSNARHEATRFNVLLGFGLALV